MIPLVNEFVINKWLTYFSTRSINSGSKNQKMYGISGLCSYIYILLRIAMSLHSVRESNESKWLLLSKCVTFYFLFFFFLPLSSLSLYLFSSLYPGSGMRLLCPRFLSFILDSRWDVQRSCYNVADCRLALVLWWRRRIATAPLRLNCVDWRAVTHLRSNILELEIR